jgi:polyisoprenoid-binding protein YceI
MQAGPPARPLIYALSIMAVLGLSRAEGADLYRLDSAHTRVAFEVERFGIRWVTADFREISGELVLDRHDHSGLVDVRVGIGSVDCSDARWNERLTSTEWLDARHYPWMTFRAEDIELEDGRATARGQLTLHGITRPVTLNVTFADCTDGNSCQFDGHARVKRSDFGLPHGFWTGGDQVENSIGGAVSRPISNPRPTCRQHLGPPDDQHLNHPDHST